MSMPTIPTIDPSINITRDDSINIILSSIGMEELSLAHIVNAEAEKIQFALGTLETSNGAASLEDIITVNNTAKKMLRDVIKNQMLIGMKMEDTVELAEMVFAKNNETPVEPTPVAAPAVEEPVAQG